MLRFETLSSLEKALKKNPNLLMKGTVVELHGLLFKTKYAFPNDEFLEGRWQSYGLECIQNNRIIHCVFIPKGIHKIEVIE